ncbi:1-phosphofructokinase [Turicibacter sanguinis]|nr:1-phosphofructokinase [Turicibacter sanguinis]MTN51026.1 1-phosphofructokinase [Turicibacter sanguinis]MTN54074.1 1-phosphofructokinase [Turicibacter sanguinis]MTN57207.1 1-phosphofructokinase [Turicibacter sanguinis]MTN60272.1 1-phosphofructokinase [Turicibacter sanguinis]
MITTITLNPALDKLMESESLQVGETNRADILNSSAAGKGIDVAKVLRDFKREVNATGFLGGIVAPIFKECFEDEKINDHFIAIEGQTRTNIQLFDKSGKRTEILEKGPEVSSAEKEALIYKVEELAKVSSVVAICGSAPRGVDEAYFTELIQLAKANCHTVIVDASGALLKVAIKQKPKLIKPNKDEMFELMGVKSATQEEMIEFAQHLCQEGIEYVLISLGKEGAMLVSQKGVWKGLAPDVDVKSTLGCGDTVVASMCISFDEGDEPAVMLKKAIALSSANAMTFETAHVILKDYEELLPRCEVETIK